MSKSVASKTHRRDDLSRIQSLRLSAFEVSERIRSEVFRSVERARQIRILGAAFSLVSGITTFGWVVGAVSLICLAAGLVNSWTELVFIGVLGSVVVLIALAWSAGSSGYEVKLRLENQRVTVGNRALGELAISNPTGRALPATVIELLVGTNTASFITKRLASGGEQSEPFGITTSRRGIVTVGPATAVRGDSLGLVKRMHTWSEAMELYIHPRTINIGASAIGFIRDIEGVTTHELSSSDVSFHALRDYVPGDDRRNIHWRTTARVGKLMVRQFEETRRAHLLIVLDLNDEAWANEDEFEEGVSGAASLALAAMRESKEVSIITQGGMLQATTGMRALDSLSGVELLSAAERLPTLSRKASGAVPQASVAMIITGSNTSIDSLHTSLAHLPLDTTSFGTRFDVVCEVGLHTVGGFTIVSVPSVEDFALAMRRVLA